MLIKSQSYLLIFLRVVTVFFCYKLSCSYKQQKFNLFREENEGYSKLVVELGHEERPLAAAPAMLDNIRSLIGQYHISCVCIQIRVAFIL